MYINLLLLCVKYNYTDIQISQALPQNEIKNSFLLLLVATLTGMCFSAVRNMLPEQQEVLHNRPVQTFCVYLKPDKYIKKKITEVE